MLNEHLGRVSRVLGLVVILSLASHVCLAQATSLGAIEGGGPLLGLSVWLSAAAVCRWRLARLRDVCRSIDAMVFLSLGLLTAIKVSLLHYPDFEFAYPYLNIDSWDWLANGHYYAGSDVRYSVRPPGLPLIIAGLHLLGSVSLLPILNQIVFAAWTWIFYRFTAATFGARCAVVATAFFYFNFLLNGFSNFVMADLYAGLGITISVMMFSKAGTNPKFYLHSALAAGASLYFQYAAIVLVPTFALFILAFRRRHLRVPSLWTALLIGPLAISPWFLYRLVAFGDPLYSNVVHGDLFYWHTHSIGFYGFNLVAALGLPVTAILVLGFPRTISGGHRETVRLQALLLLFTIVFWVFLYDWSSRRFLLYWMFPLFFFVAAGIDGILNRIRLAGWPVRTAGVFLLVVAFFYGQIGYLNTEGMNRLWPTVPDKLALSPNHFIRVDSQRVNSQIRLDFTNIELLREETPPLVMGLSDVVSWSRHGRAWKWNPKKTAQLQEVREYLATHPQPLDRLPWLLAPQRNRWLMDRNRFGNILGAELRQAMSLDAVSSGWVLIEKPFDTQDLDPDRILVDLPRFTLYNADWTPQHYRDLEQIRDHLSTNADLSAKPCLLLSSFELWQAVCAQSSEMIEDDFRFAKETWEIDQGVAIIDKRRLAPSLDLAEERLLLELHHLALYDMGPGLKEDRVRLLRSLHGEVGGDRFGQTLRELGDINGDGISEILVGAPGNGDFAEKGGGLDVLDGVTLERIWTHRGSHLYGELGTSLAAGGDVDGDGTLDYAAGAPGQPKGRVFVFSGAHHTVLHEWTGMDFGDRFGASVCLVGDLDQDGHDDVLVAAPDCDSSLANSGRVFVFSGQTGTLLRTHRGTHVGERLGQEMESLGDIDGDAIEDYGLVSSRGLTIHSGKDGTQLRRHTVTSGLTLAGVGDLDGDGVSELYIEERARSVMISGREGSVLWAQEKTRPHLAKARCAGDVDGDGLDDVLATSSTGAPGGGAVTIRRGRDGLLLRTFTGKFAHDGLGADALMVEDVNDDGQRDLLLTTTRYDRERGRLLVLAGERPLLLSIDLEGVDRPVVGISIDGAMPNQPCLLVLTGIEGHPMFRPLLSTRCDEHGRSSVSAPLPDGCEGKQIELRAFALSPNGRPSQSLPTALSFPAGREGS